MAKRLSDLITGAPAGAGEDQVKADFLAGRAAVGQGGNDDWMRRAAAAGEANSSGSPANISPAKETGAAADPSTKAQDETEPNQFQAEAGGIPTPIGAKMLSALWGVGSDVLRGSAEMPAAALRGVIGGVQEMSRTGLSLEVWRDKHLPDWVGDYVFAGPFHVPSWDRASIERDTGKSWDELLGEAEKKADLKGVAPAPETYTGTGVENVTQWSTARAILGAPVAAAGLTGAVGEAVKDFLAGGMGMDPRAQRLSNIVDDVAPNWLTDFLKAKPDDNEALARLKSGLEYAGIGQVFELVKKGAVAVKDALGDTTKGRALGGLEQLGEGKPLPEGAAVAEGAPGTQPGAEPAPGAGLAPAAEIAPGGPPAAGPRDILRLGDPLDEAVQAPPVTPEIKQQALDFLSGKGGDNPVTINLGRVSDVASIRDTIEQASRYIPAGQVTTYDALQQQADMLGATPQELLSGWHGTGHTAEELLAGRMVLDSSAKQLVDYAAAAADPTRATPEAKALFFKAFATHRAIQQTIEGAESEAGRTLGALNIISSSRSDLTQGIRDIVEAGGGDKELATIADRIASLGDPEKASALVAEMSRQPGRQAITKIYYNLLLSNPRTIIKKLISDTGIGIWNVATTYASEKFGPSGAVQPGEAASLAYGYISSLKDAVRIAGRALAAGESQFHANYQTMEGAPSARLAVLSDNAPQSLAQTPTRAALEYLRSALPTSWIGAADDFAKYANYRAEIYRLAYRAGMDKGLDGDALNQSIEDTLTTVPRQIHQQALEASLRSTFQEPLTGMAASMQQAVDKINIPLAHTDLEIPLGRIIMPFIKVPTNIVRWSYRNGPLPLAFPSSAMRAEMAAGGATRDLAMARIGLGTAASLAIADLALTGRITGAGPTDPSLHAAWERSDGKPQPYSVNVGGNWYQYNQVEPFGLMTGAIADSFNVMRFAKDQDNADVAASLVLGTGNAMLSKTYMRGFADFLDALAKPETKGENWGDRLAASWATPQGVAGLAQAIDPWRRAHYGLLDGIEARTPWASTGLPPVNDQWGRPIPAKDGFFPFLSGTGAARMLSPVPYAASDGAEPIDKWTWDNRAAFPSGDQGRLGLFKAGRVQTFSDGPHVSVPLELSPTQTSRLQQLAGNQLKDEKGTGLGAMDLLNALVQGRAPADWQGQWNKMSPQEQAAQVISIVDKYRNEAKKKLVNDNVEGLKYTLQEAFKAKRMQMQQGEGTAPAPGAAPGAAQRAPTIQ